MRETGNFLRSRDHMRSRHDKILALHAKGLSTGQIADRFGLDRAWIARLIATERKSKGLPTPGRWPEKK